MAPPSKSFTIIPDADIDPDSALTSSLFTRLRDNDIHLEEWLGLSFVAAQDHDHDGVNSKKAVGAGLFFLERHETSADETSFDFSAALDGDTEAVYLLTGRWKKSGVAQTLILRANGASVATVISSAPASPSLIGLYFFGLHFAKRTVQTESVNAGYVGVDLDSAAPAGVVRGDDFTLAANLTSLGVLGSIASGIRKGSEFTLYRLAQV